MLLGFSIIIGGLGLIMLFERIFPDQKLKKVSGWWTRVIIINLCQLLIVVTGIYTWEWLLGGTGLFNLQQYMNPAIGGFVAYLINTWIFYWWHRARHEIYILWLLCHQVHHSAQRIEAVTSFYKHPLEIVIDSIMMTVLLYPILGLSSQSSIWLSGFSAFGEYFYHMNIRTPRWMGYIFQRPESHRVHHLRNKRVSCKNYSDFPIWDWLAETFDNPDKMDEPTGFDPEAEADLTSMMKFKDVLKISSNRGRIVSYGYTLLLMSILIIGLLQPIGYIFNAPSVRGLGIITVASPLPLVFTSYNGIETFSTTFHLNITLSDNSTFSMPMSHDIYSKIQGPYNRRNVYGAVFSHGPFFQHDNLIKLRQRILHHGICDDNLGFNDIILEYKSNAIVNFSQEPLIIQHILVTVKSKTKGNENQRWTMEITC